MPGLSSVAIESVDFFVRNQTMRLPFRYGNACLTSSPILHVRLKARDRHGRTAIGVSADILPPKWFDKDPAKDYRRNISDLVGAAQIGASWFQHHSATAQPVFDLWRHAQSDIITECADAGLNGLTGSFGVSIIERAAIDAACRLSGAPYHVMLRENRFGIEPVRIHGELGGLTPAEVIPPAPLEHVHIRHTVGLGDAIWDEEVSEAGRIDDGLPVSLEAWLREAEFRYLKIKVTGKLDQDVARLDSIARLLDQEGLAHYRVSLDGNEQFHSAAELKQWFDVVREKPRLRALLQRTLFVEQPIERAAALDPASAALFHGLDDLPPVIIDESDDALDSFARAAAMGYRGTSVKNCKGVFKGVLNAMLVHRYRREQGVEYLLTAEDLANQPIVSLQQDLCSISTLGIAHVERNGHQYGGTLAHLAPEERAAALRDHDDLYEPHREVGRWRIREGQLAVGSLHRGGFGVPEAPDFHGLIPLADWDYAMLGLGSQGG